MATLAPSEIEGVWLNAGGNGSQAVIAAAVAMAESSGNTLATAHNTGPPPSTDYGLWQINSGSGGSTLDYDPAVCARHAISISDDGTTWRRWCTAYTDGACGTKGGVYAPFGNSPSGRWYQQLQGAPVAAPPGPSGPAGVPTVGTPAGALSGWHQLTHALSKGLIGELHSSDHMVAAANRRLARVGRR